MNKRVNFILFLVLLIVLLGVIKIIIDAKNNKFPDAISKVISKGNFEIEFPESTDYRAYSYDDKDVRLYLSFNPELISNYTLEGFIDNFNYINIWVKFPDKKTAFSRVYYSNREPIREIKFTSYENNILSGELSLTINNIITETHNPRDENCITDDMAGLCYGDEEVKDIPYTLKFSLTIPR